MRKFLLELGKYFKTVISYSSDKRVIMLNDEKPCCKRFKKLERLHVPAIGAYWLAVSYCPCCGKRLER
jgi:hypothetical protein